MVVTAQKWVALNGAWKIVFLRVSSVLLHGFHERVKMLVALPVRALSVVVSMESRGVQALTQSRYSESAVAPDSHYY